jgi:hypothetical protein
MGWDIVFSATLSPAADPAARWRALQAALARRPGFVKLWSFEVRDDPFYWPRDPLARLDSNLQGATPVTDEGVAGLLDRYAGADDVAFRGLWETRGARAGGATMGAVEITVFGAKMRWRGRLPRPIDVTWDAGDSRRYTAEGKGDHPSVAQVIEDLEVLVELGAESFWGVDADMRLTPDNLYAAYHRDPNAYRHDGVHEPFRPVEIDNEYVRLCAEESPKHSFRETPGGPIVYAQALGEGRLNYFYARLEGVLCVVSKDAADREAAARKR